jgi:hypothetical protein
MTSGIITHDATARPGKDDSSSRTRNGATITRAAVIDADWRRVQREAEYDLILRRARMRAGGLLALQLPLFSEQVRAELLELASLVAALNAIALDAQRRHPVPFDRWLERLGQEARRLGRFDDDVAYSLRNIAAAVDLSPWWYPLSGVAA